METPAPEAYVVVVNREEQHALLPAHAPIPAGWELVLSVSSKTDCLAYVADHWTNILPRSLRVKELGDHGEGNAT